MASLARGLTTRNLTSLAATLQLALLLLIPGMPASACEGSGPMRQVKLSGKAPTARVTICLAPGTLTTLLFDRPLLQPALPASAQERFARWEEGSSMLRLEPLMSSQPQELLIHLDTHTQPSAVALSIRLEPPGSPEVDEVVNFTSEESQPASCRQALRQMSEQVKKLEGLCLLRQIALPEATRATAPHEPIPLAAFMEVLKSGRPLDFELAAATWRSGPELGNHIMNGLIYRSSGWSLLKLDLISPASRATEWLTGRVQMEDLLGNAIKVSHTAPAGDGTLLVGVARELPDKATFALKVWPAEGRHPMLHYRIFLPAPSSSPPKPARPARPAEPGKAR